jgi:hypothetical protein
VARPHDAHRGERAQACPDGRAADADLRREIAFRREAVAGSQRAALDELAYVGHDLTGPARGRYSARDTSAAQ